MAHQGYDTLTVDLQHGVNDEMNLIAMLQAISTTGLSQLFGSRGWSQGSS